MKRLFIVIFTFVMMVTMMVDCNQDKFDETVYDSTLVRLFPSDAVSSSQDWRTLATANYSISVNTGDKTPDTIKIYSANPAINMSDTLLTKAVVTSGSTATGSFIYSIARPNVYVVCVNSSGRVCSKSASASDGTLSVSFSSSDKFVTAYVRKDVDPIYTFCFDDSYPQPEDFDFNDIVMYAIPHHDALNPKHLRLTFSLEAIGSLKQLGAAVRLYGVKTTMVDSIVRTSTFYGEKDGNQWQWTQALFDEKEFKSTDGYITDKVENRGLVILPLFNDAHFALNDRIYRAYYNVTSRSAREALPQSVTFDIYLNDDSHVLPLENPYNLDMFLLYGSGVSAIEIHQYRFKAERLLYDRTIVDTKNYTWGLIIPGQFEYPLEGHPISVKESARDTIKTVAYPYFTKWAANPNAYKEWYRINNYSVVHRIYYN